MIVVGDASPLIALASIGQLKLLRGLYGSILVPAGVAAEIAEAGYLDLAQEAVEAGEWIETREVSDRALVSALEIQLDHGESEAIALAIEREADLLLMDERRGRQIATRLGVHVIGVLGILIAGKTAGLISEVRPLLDSLERETGFRLSSSLRDRVLETAGE